MTVRMQSVVFSKASKASLISFASNGTIRITAAGIFNFPHRMEIERVCLGQLVAQGHHRNYSIRRAKQF